MNQTRTNQTHKTRQNKRKQTSEASNLRYETNAQKQNKQANIDEKLLREKPLRAWWGTEDLWRTFSSMFLLKLLSKTFDSVDLSLS